MFWGWLLLDTGLVHIRQFWKLMYFKSKKLGTSYTNYQTFEVSENMCPKGCKPCQDMLFEKPIYKTSDLTKNTILMIQPLLAYHLNTNDQDLPQL